MAQPNRPTPRPHLTIVAGLGLDAIKVGKAASPKAKAPIRTAGADAANDDTIPESSRNNTLASLAVIVRPAPSLRRDRRRCSI